MSNEEAKQKDMKVKPEQRMAIWKAAPEQYKAMSGLNRSVEESGLEHSLLELVKMRSSQLNGCAFCLDMHSKDAFGMGETAQRLIALNAWRETPFFTARERAALALTEAVTLIAQGEVEDAVYTEAQAHFTEAELAKLIWAIAAINAWNRIAVTTRATVGDYKPEAAR